MILTKPPETIQKLRPQAKTIIPIEEGVINQVFLVDNEVFRFPREEEGGQVLMYEAAILEKIAGQMSVKIPKLIELGAGGSYIILAYVPGQMLSSEDIMALTPKQKRSLAKTLVQCLREINAVLSLNEVKTLIKKYIPWQLPEEEFYKSIIKSHTESKYYSLYALSYERFAQRKKILDKADEIIVHGDFHYGNMLFNDEKELTGLIDFGQVNIGTVTTELRQIYRLGEDIVGYMVSELGDEFGMVDLELIRLHAIIHEVWVLMRTEGKEPPKDGRDELARKLLTQWLGKNWGEL